MKRVLVVGPGGSGKSTLARRLAARTGLPLIHLDTLYWRPGWEAPAKDEWERTVRELVRRDAWIIDGNYGATLDPRLDAADTVIFLDLPRRTCLRRIVQRRLRFRGRSRPDMAEGCPEQLTWAFLRWVWTFPKERRPILLRKLEGVAGEKDVITLRSPADVERFLASVDA